jgi:hypothetical protein
VSRASSVLPGVGPNVDQGVDAGPCEDGATPLFRGRPDVTAALTRPADLNPEASTGPVEKAYGPIERSSSTSVGGDRHAGKRYTTTYDVGPRSLGSAWLLYAVELWRSCSRVLALVTWNVETSSTLSPGAHRWQ